MPLKRCQANGKSGWKWGNKGKCYTGPGAKKKAIKQGVAMGEAEEGTEIEEEEPLASFGGRVAADRKLNSAP